MTEFKKSLGYTFCLKHWSVVQVFNQMQGNVFDHAVCVVSSAGSFASDLYLQYINI